MEIICSLSSGLFKTQMILNDEYFVRNANKSRQKFVTFFFGLISWFICAKAISSPFKMYQMDYIILFRSLRECKQIFE